jgi:hypothetical protein
MTLWDRTVGLILGLALFTLACEEPGEIGLEINPENGAFVARYFEIPLDNSIIQQEDVLSGSLTRINFNDITQKPSSDGRLLVGGYNTPEFGAFKATSFSNIYFTKFGFASHGFTFDSLIFNIKIDYIYGNEFMGNKKIAIHELSEDILLDSVYLTKNSTAYFPDPVGEFNFNLSAFDTIFVDTVFSTRLSDEFGMKLFDKAGEDSITFFDNRVFREFFKGIALVPDESNSMVAGIHAESPSTFMRMYFHNEKDTTFLDFTIDGFTQDTTIVGNDTTFQIVNLTRYYNNITLDKSGSAIAGIPGYYTEFQTDDDFTYIQASSGVFTKLDFGKYYEFLDTVPNLVINRAELILPVKTFQNYLQPSLSLSLYPIDEGNKFIKVEQSGRILTYLSFGGLSYSGFQNENRGQYEGNITGFIQGITSGDIENVQILVAQSSLDNSILSVNQTLLEKRNILLRVYYSSL